MVVLLDIAVDLLTGDTASTARAKSKEEILVNQY